MKRFAFLLVALGLLLAPASGKTSEVGLLLGGGIDIDNSYDNFTVGPYFAGSPAQQPLHYYLPITFSIGLGLPAGADAYLFNFQPGFEYDIPFFIDHLFLVPGFGVSLAYQKVPGSHQFQVGLVPMLQVKYVLNEKFIFRFAPVNVYLSPWRYGSGGLGSDTTFSATYNLSAGFGYDF